MKLSKRAFVVLGVIFALVLGGVAVAAWLTSGTGPAQGQAVTAQNLTVTARSGPADLYPGGPAGAVYFTVSNPNPYPVTLTGVTYGAISGGAGGCTATAPNIVLAATPPATITPSLVVPASGSSDGSLAGVLSMPTTAANECQGATFLVQITVTGASS